MSNGEKLDHLERWIKLQEALDEERSAFVENLLRQNGDLDRRCDRLSRKLDSEVNSRRSWQRKFDTKKAELERVVHQSHAKPIFLVLIDGDGDGYTFKDALLKDGEAGGSQAAQLLQDSIQNKITSMASTADQWSIVVNVFANSAKLANALVDHGIIDSTATFDNFISGFNKSNALFNFVDAGSGKEGADHKIKELIHLHIDSPQYRHILCGITHDNGYVRVLTDYSDRLGRITLLEAGSSAKEFRSLGFDRWSFPSVFRQRSFPQSYSRRRSRTPDSQATEFASPATSVSRSSSRTQHGSTQDISAAAKNEIWLNADDERIDAPLSYSYKAKMAFEKRRRISGLTFCRAHYLSTCTNWKCPYSHSEQLSQDEIAAFRYKMRTILCPDGQSCRSFKCYFGHNCPYVKCTFGESCHFHKYHEMDKDVKNKKCLPETLAVPYSLPILQI